MERINLTAVDDSYHNLVFKNTEAKIDFKLAFKINKLFSRFDGGFNISFMIEDKLNREIDFLNY